MNIGENCDDGNTRSGDGCSAICDIEVTIVAASGICGDGLINGTEECDDGNRRDFDGCTSTCELESGFCGDGIVQSLLGEQCEPSLHSTNLQYGCSTDCSHISIFCGDGNKDAGEQCDEGGRNSNSPNANCRTNCSLASCGDGILDSVLEFCDDGNNLLGDGCDRFCKPEAPAAPTTPTQVFGQMAQFQSAIIPFQYQDAQGVTHTVQIPVNQLAQGLAPMQQQQQIAGQIASFGQQYLPSMANFQPLPYQVQLPQVASRAPVGDTGPAALMIMIGGAAAGVGWTRKKRRK